MPHGQTAREEHGRHLGGGFADLLIEGRGLLDNQHAQLRMLPPQQDGRGRSAEGPAKDDDVVMLHSAMLAQKGGGSG